MISKVLCDLPFSGNQSLKSADEKQINKIKRKTRQWDTVIESWNM
jgi:hypothetical protein